MDIRDSFPGLNHRRGIAVHTVGASCSYDDKLFPITGHNFLVIDVNI